MFAQEPPPDFDVLGPGKAGHFGRAGKGATGEGMAEANHPIDKVRHLHSLSRVDGIPACLGAVQFRPDTSDDAGSTDPRYPTRMQHATHAAAQGACSQNGNLGSIRTRNWRRERDSNPRWLLHHGCFQAWCNGTRWVRHLLLRTRRGSTNRHPLLGPSVLYATRMAHTTGRIEWLGTSPV